MGDVIVPGRLCFAVALAMVLAPALAAVANDRAPSAVEITAHIDRYFGQVWRQAGKQSVEPATDAVFLRRVYLDVVGHVPPVAVVRRFLADQRPAKRAELVESLLASGEYGRNAAMVWRRCWLPQSDARQFERQADEFETWFAEKVDRDASYDRLVEALLTVADFADENPPDPLELPTPAVLLAVSEGQPDNLAANSMRAFAGVQLECAECHDHPFAPWKREQFWQTAAFFAHSARSRPATREPPPLQISIPGTKQIVAAALLDGSSIAWPAERMPAYGRRAFAAWLTQAGNPYFARNAINKLWQQLFGRPLAEFAVDPTTNAAALAPRRLLDELAGDFTRSGFDLKRMTAAILLSRPYQVAESKAPGDGASDDFASYPLRLLGGEQLHASLLLVGGLSAASAGAAIVERRQFVTKFSAAPEARPSILQTLTLMNGSLVQKITDPQSTPQLIAVAESPFFDDDARIETLYLATVSRLPTEHERRRALMLLQRAATDSERLTALADLLWALVNGSEFRTNH